MVDFVICDDNSNVREINEAIISKIAMPYDFNYKVHSFESYNVGLKNVINTPSDLKIYILDLEMPGKNGIDIAREIRKVDWDSTIIILTSHDELELKLYKEKLLILDFISKFDNYEQKLKDSINMVLKRRDNRKSLNFKSNKELHHVKLDNIFYICKDSYSEKVIIKTTDNEYLVRDSLSNIVSSLNSSFIQTHRACYVNKDKIESVDFKNNIIYFDNDTSIDYLSRNYKKNLREEL